MRQKNKKRKALSPKWHPKRPKRPTRKSNKSKPKKKGPQKGRPRALWRLNPRARPTLAAPQRPTLLDSTEHCNLHTLGPYTIWKASDIVFYDVLSSWDGIKPSVLRCFLLSRMVKSMYFTMSVKSAPFQNSKNDSLQGLQKAPGT